MFLCLIIFSCSDDNGRESETSEFLGKWKLVESLIDPGDGSGTFEPIVGDYNIEFLSNGNVVSNYSLCTMNPTSGDRFTAPYFADDNHIIPNNCFPDGYNITYQIEGENLILHYPCIEACAHKFIRIEP